MDKKKLIDALNEDLAGELSAITQYLTYAAKANGPYRPQLAAFFMAEVPDETGHAQYLSNKIVALGGDPTTKARAVAPAQHNKDMIERALEAEKRAISDYSMAIKLSPRDAMAHLNRGSTYYSIGRDNDAIRDLTKAIKLDPKEADAYYWRALVYRRMGKAKKADEDDKKYSQLGGDEGESI